MLREPAPFPQVGSYALIEQDGRTHLVRLVKRNADQSIVIAFPLMPDIASGNRTTAIDQLIDATPLTAEEKAELDALELYMMGRLPGARQTIKADRYSALSSRNINSEVMARLMARMPDRTRRSSVLGEAA